MALINRPPTGLLSLLGIKAGGVNPAQLADYVQPTLDLSLLYLSGAVEFADQTDSITGVGVDPSSVIVPDGQYWYVLDFSVYSNAALGAGQTLEYVPAFSYLLAGANRTLLVGEKSNVATVGLHSAARMDRPRLAQPGTTFATLCTNLVAGPVTVRFLVQFVRLGI